MLGEKMARPKRLDAYEEWLPQGRADEKSHDAVLGVSAQLVGKDGSPTQRRAKFTFSLKDVSRQPGTCLNHPAQGATADLDLVFESTRNKHLAVFDDGQRAVSAERTPRPRRWSPASTGAPSARSRSPPSSTMARRSRAGS